MSKLILLFATVAITLSVCVADVLLTADVVRDLNKKVSDVLLDAKGVNSTGISKCGNEVCILITTETETAEKALKILYPGGSRIGGVLVEVENIGEIVAQ